MKTILLGLLAACQLPAALTPSVVEEGTYKLHNDEGQGTGWAVSEHYMVTAGHMCREGKGQKLRAISSTHDTFTVEVVDAEEVDTDTEHKDVCLMHSDRPLPHPLILASEMPKVGTPAFYVGYPLGDFVRSEGVYKGDTDGPDATWNDYVVTTTCDHGASGSAFFTAAGVFGVLVRLQVIGEEILPGNEGCVATPLADITGMLKANGIELPTK